MITNKILLFIKLNLVRRIPFRINYGFAERTTLFNNVIRTECFRRYINYRRINNAANEQRLLIRFFNIIIIFSDIPKITVTG